MYDILYCIGKYEIRYEKHYDFCNYIKPCFWCPFLLRLSRSFAHPNAISQKIQGKYTCAVGWVGHVLKNVIELHLSQNTGAVVLLKMLRLSLKPKSFRNFKTTWVCFEIEYGPNSGNAKSLWAFSKLSFASCCKKLIENKMASSKRKLGCASAMLLL